MNDLGLTYWHWGMSTKFRVLTVCHCEINEDTIRIISARKADKNEIKQYEGYGHA